MNLKVIGAGYGRTGTLSTYTALKQLGYPCYHMFEVIENKANKTHLGFWNDVANSKPGQQHKWKEVLANYTACVDNPTACVYKELLEANPEAKVILTLHPRGAEAWYQSTMDTIYFTELKWEFKFLEKITPFAKKMGNMTRKLIWQRNHQGTMNDKAAAIDRYNKHIEEVKSHVPAAQLLIFSVDQGWEPLCNFLGEKVPEGDFPRVNDREEIKSTIRNITKGAYIILTMMAVMLGGLAFGLIKWLG